MQDAAATRTWAVDAHAHVWDLGRRPQPWIDPSSMAVLVRDFEAGELASDMVSAGVSSAVLVQVLNDQAESDELMWVGAAHPFSGVVPWVDLLSADLEDRLDG